MIDRGVALGIIAVALLTLATMGAATAVLVVALAVSYALWVRRSHWPGAQRVVPLYAVAVLVQYAHLAEEYRGEFHRLFPPAFGAEPWSGRRFLIFNLVWLAAFIVAGIGLLRENRVAYLVALFLALGGGIGNGLGHLALAARARGYFPGAYTGVLALLAGSALLFRLVKTRAETEA